MPRTINLPSERVQQLERLAEKWNMTIADVIGHLIHQQIEQGVLEPDIPGIKVEKDGKEVRIGTEEWNKVVSAQSATKLSEAIRTILTPSKDNPFMPLPEFDLARRGTSLKWRDPETGGEKTLAPSIARDVADLIERTAKS